jgi:FAD/FMN-containing dehydrogenase
LGGHEIRQAGLGKDITNKALSGLPGLQKEGTDGIITSARFILHRAYPEQTTCCLEFFGADMDEASRAIGAICEAFVNRGEETLMALEHFDDAYVRAIGYKVKAPRQDLPKAVLLVDMVGHHNDQIRRGIQRLQTLMADYPNTHLFVAENEQEARRFWRDRKRLGAIAARTRKRPNPWKIRSGWPPNCLRPRPCSWRRWIASGWPASTISRRRPTSGSSKPS